MSGRTDCARCQLYAMSRGPRIKAEIAKTSTGAEAAARWRGFVDGYHRLHTMAGRFAALMAVVREAEEGMR